MDRPTIKQIGGAFALMALAGLTMAACGPGGATPAARGAPPPPPPS